MPFALFSPNATVAVPVPSVNEHLIAGAAFSVQKSNLLKKITQFIIDMLIFHPAGLK